jgi:hypothetical protein
MKMDLKSMLNACKPSTPYTKITDLREECAYRVVQLERVNTPYGETVMATLEGQVGEDFYLRVYLPRRYIEIITDAMIEQYNTGYGERMHLVRRAAAPGSRFTPLEFM